MGLVGVCCIAEACWYGLVEISSIGFKYLNLAKIRLMWSKLVAWCSKWRIFVDFDEKSM